MQITCLEVRRELSNYIDDDVSAALRSEIEQHFAACTGCSVMYDSVRNVISLMQDGRTLELPSGFSRRLYLKLGATLAN